LKDFPDGSRMRRRRVGAAGAELDTFLEIYINN